MGHIITRLVWIHLALGAMLIAADPAFAQKAQPAPKDEVLRVSRNGVDDTRPLVVAADHVVHWDENGKRIVLLKGSVLLQQGTLQARFDQGVAWIDVDRFNSSRVWHVDLYLEGNVEIQSGRQSDRGNRALLELNTRGQLKWDSHKSQIQAARQGDDPLFRRAFAVRFPDAGPPDSGVIQAGGPVPPPPTPQIKQTGAREEEKPTIIPVQATAPDNAPPLPTLQAPAPGEPPSETAPPPRRAPGEAKPEAPPKPEPARQFSIAPRTCSPFQTQVVTVNPQTGEQALVVTGGVILHVMGVDKIGIIDVEADQLVVWYKGNSHQLFGDIQKPEGTSGREIDFYLSGNVEMRQQSFRGVTGRNLQAGGILPTAPVPSGFNPKALPGGGVRQTVPGLPPGTRGGTVGPTTTFGVVTRTLRADEVYYDVARNVAIAVHADLEMMQPGFPEPLHMKGDEIRQVGPTIFEGVNVEVSASRLPSDPGFKGFVRDASLEVVTEPKRTIFGTPVYDRETGQPMTVTKDMLTARNVLLTVQDVPIFWSPYLYANAQDPLGPLQSVHFGFSRIFGAHLGATLDMYQLLGIDPPDHSRWFFDADWLSERGPGIGSRFYLRSNDFLGIPAKYYTTVKAFGMQDVGEDILGGNRGENDDHPLWRGRVLWRQNVSEMPDGFSLQTSLGLLSDHNFLEQYYKQEFDMDPNQETYVYLRQQQDNWFWSILTEPHLRNWVTETEWLPRLDGAFLGYAPLDVFTYNVRANAGYAELIPTKVGPPPVVNTDQRINTARFDLWQDLSLPFYVGPVKVVPYGVLDLTYYSNDLQDDSAGRIYGGGGVRTSLPFSRIYPGVCSEYLNLNGINHKLNWWGNYYIAGSSVAFNTLPQLDRLDDDATDQAIRDITPQQPVLNPTDGIFLQTDPLFNLQRYAIRRLVDTRVDTLDDIQVFQFGLQQRWQTKRGYPGMQHIVDWMTLDLSASAFPAPDRDNFGSTFAFLEYNWLWNIGDRTSIQSTGWIDPIEHGARVFTIGAYLDRTDRTSVYIGYREIEPVHSRLVTASLGYTFSPKYAMTASTAYDFGTTQSLANTLMFTRMGSDLQVSMGITYNAMQNNFGLLFEILPTGSGRQGTATRSLGAGGLN